VGSSRRILKRTADPARSILEIVDELGIDLVALDAAPAGGLRRFRAPDVAHRVIDSGRVPVLLVGKEYVPQAPNLRRLLLPFDPFVPSRPLLEMASQVSRRAQAEVVVLGFIPIPVQPEDQGIVFADEPLHRVTPEARISDFARDLAALGCRVRSLHAYEEPLEAIPRYARSLDVDMILMGKTGWGQGGRSMFDGMSHQLAVSLECPLLFGGSAWRGRRRAPLAG
jgi:nucleotide-binding universal stress UspA family protein